MQMTEEKYNVFKESVSRVMPNCRREYMENITVHAPNSFLIKYTLKHFICNTDWVSNSLLNLGDIFHVNTSQEFTIKSRIAFEFYYTKHVETLSDVYTTRIIISHLTQDIKKVFSYNNLAEFITVLKEIIGIFEQDIVAGNTDRLDMSIENFKNYCAIAGL